MSKLIEPRGESDIRSLPHRRSQRGTLDTCPSVHFTRPSYNGNGYFLLIFFRTSIAVSFGLLFLFHT